MEIDFDNKIPIYIQIMNLIKGDIVAGMLKIGESLPSVRALSADLKVNPNTIQKAYQELEREGLAYTKRGMGRFVTEDKKIIDKIKREMAITILDQFVSGMTQLGFTPEEMLHELKENLKREGDINGSDTGSKESE